jgi:hypothetical protein
VGTRDNADGCETGAWTSGRTRGKDDVGGLTKQGADSP